MADIELENIELGSAPDGQGGDSDRTAWAKVNDNNGVLKAAINGLSGSSGTLQTDVSTLQTGVETLNAEVDTLQTDVSAIQNSYAKRGSNSDIEELAGLKKNVTQPANAAIGMESVTLNQLNSAIASISGGGGSGSGVMTNFLGAIEWFNGSRSALPAGHLAADGQLLNRADYPELWTQINTGILNSVTDTVWLASTASRASFSKGDGSTTFRMPDINGIQTGSLKGLFLRGDGKSASGTVLSDAIRNITAGLGAKGAVAWQNPSGALFNPNTYQAQASQAIGSGDRGYTALNFDASRIVPTADENRPVSASYIAIIRVKGVAIVETQQKVISASTATLATGDIVQGGQVQSVYTNKGTQLASATMSAIKTVGTDGTTIQFNAVDNQPTTPVATQWNLDKSGGTILTSGNPAGGRTALGLGSAATYAVGTSGATVPLLNTANTWTAIQTYNSGASIRLNQTAPAVGSGSSFWGATNVSFYVGINHANSSTNLYQYEEVGVSSGLRMQVNYTSSTRNDYNFKDNGTATALNWSSTSDARIKKNLKRITDPLSIMQKLNGYTWNYKTNDKFGIGLVAQEVEKVFPDLVENNGATTLSNGEIVIDTKVIDAGQIAAGLHHEAILALLDKIEALEIRVKELENA